MRQIVNESEKEFIKMAKNFLEKDMKERYGDFVTIDFDNEKYKTVETKELDKLEKERLDWGYDSVCLRVNELVQELAYLKTFDKTTNRCGDLEYWKHFYGKRAIRIYQILDDLLGGIHNNDIN